jgi:hypothetical protein
MTKSYLTRPSVRLALAGIAAACLMPLVSPCAYAGDAKPNHAEGMQIMQKQMSLMTPELQAKAKALSPEIKKFLTHVAAKHTHKSETLTLAQVMQEIMADTQAIAMALAMDNPGQAADAARRIADHKLPRGGLLPYLPLEKVNSDDLAAMPGFEHVVEGGAMRIAEAAEKGDMANAAGHFGDMMRGCVACHQHLRGQPGMSPRVRPAGQ